MSTTRPAAPAYTEFMSFMVSTIPTTVSSPTIEPTSTKGGAPGLGAREKVPTIGVRTSINPATGVGPPAAGGTGTADANSARSCVSWSGPGTMVGTDLT